MLLVLGGVCDICSETRGGQYFAAEGREIEGPPPLRMFLAASLKSMIDGCLDFSAKFVILFRKVE